MIPMTTALGLGALAVIAVLVLTGNHHRGAILAAFLSGIVLAAVTGVGSALVSALSGA